MVFPTQPRGISLPEPSTHCLSLVLEPEPQDLEHEVHWAQVLHWGQAPCSHGCCSVSVSQSGFPTHVALCLVFTPPPHVSNITSVTVSFAKSNQWCKIFSLFLLGQYFFCVICVHRPKAYKNFKRVYLQENLGAWWPGGPKRRQFARCVETRLEVFGSAQTSVSRRLVVFDAFPCSPSFTFSTSLSNAEISKIFQHYNPHMPGTLDSFLFQDQVIVYGTKNNFQNEYCTIEMRKRLRSLPMRILGIRELREVNWLGCIPTIPSSLSTRDTCQRCILHLQMVLPASTHSVVDTLDCERVDHLQHLSIYSIHIIA